MGAFSVEVQTLSFTNTDKVFEFLSTPVQSNVDNIVNIKKNILVDIKYDLHDVHNTFKFL